MFKIDILPQLQSPYFIIPDVNEASDNIEKEEKEYQEFCSSITNKEVNFNAPGFEPKEEEDEEEEEDDIEMNDDSEREFEEYNDELQATSVANNDNSVY